MTVTQVTAQQRYPSKGLVDIGVTVQGTAADIAAVDWYFVATNEATKTEIPVVHISKNGDDVGSGTVWTRNFVWDMKADVGDVEIKDVALTVDAKNPGGVQLWEDGPFWAECNVGASKPEESGYYFWWGDTVGYERNAASNGWVSSQDGSSFSFSSGNCPTYSKSNSTLQSEGYIDAAGNLVAKYDAATAHLGAPWRMPTSAEIDALINNCTMTWTTRNGVYGRFVTGKGAYASKSIFLPAAGYGVDSGLDYPGSYGYYWSSTPYSDNSYCAWNLYFFSGGFLRYYNYRCYGQSVRPLRGLASVGGVGGIGMGAITTHFSFDVTVVSAVTAQQRYPWNGLVDVTVTLQGTADELAIVECTFAATNGATKAEIPVAHISKNGADTGSGTTWTRKFIWDMKADVGAVKIDEVALTVDVRELGVQLWEDGPYWAECNVGATKSEEYGYYFWWGDTVGYKRNAADNGWVSSQDGSSFSFSSGNCPTYYKSNSTLQSEGYIDATGNLVPEHDAATAHLGAPWRMPTVAEMDALVSNCTTTWMARNGVYGRLVTGKGAYASKSIFFPAAGYGDDSSLYYPGSRGYYWSSTLSSGSSLDAWYLYFYSGNFSWYSSFRYCGRSVRPLRGFAK